jgi:hypothetical protein
MWLLAAMVLLCDPFSSSFAHVTTEAAASQCPTNAGNEVDRRTHGRGVGAFRQATSSHVRQMIYCPRLVSVISMANSMILESVNE